MGTYIMKIWFVAVLVSFPYMLAAEEEEEYYDCQGTHHPHPDDPHRYKTKVGRIWYEQACNPQQLVWSQQLCECTYPSSGPSVNSGDNCSDYKPGEIPSSYKRWTGLEWENMSCDWPAPSGLVWNQKVCHCDWEPDLTDLPNAGHPPLNRPNAEQPKEECEVMVHFTFDKKIVEDSKNVWLTPINPENIRIEYDADATGRKSARFDESLLVVPFFVGNVLGSVMRIQGHNAFKELDLKYQDNLLTVGVDGQECIKSREFNGPLKVTKCPMRMPDFDFCGNLDEVKITRGCRD